MELVRRWVRFWSEPPIAKQAVSQLPLIPWGHNIVIVRKCQIRQSQHWVVALQTKRQISCRIRLERHPQTYWYL
ncbi:MAG: hypothetical protein U1B30_04875 [Pseudomonadota bacterium]|nr:hypothetical protein [Pseudomonadota bacterium]